MTQYNVNAVKMINTLAERSGTDCRKIFLMDNHALVATSKLITIITTPEKDTFGRMQVSNIGNVNQVFRPWAKLPRKLDGVELRHNGDLEIMHRDSDDSLFFYKLSRRNNDMSEMGLEIVKFLTYSITKRQNEDDGGHQKEAHTVQMYNFNYIDRDFFVFASKPPRSKGDSGGGRSIGSRQSGRAGDPHCR